MTPGLLQSTQCLSSQATAEPGLLAQSLSDENNHTTEAGLF